MIERIVMKNVASFPASGEVADGLDRVDLFFGANGSGKSTVAKFIGSPDAPEFASCGLETDGRTLPCVFDRAYRAKQFQSDALSGIFTLGSGSIELKGELSSLEDSRAVCEADIIALRQEAKSLETEKAEREDGSDALHTLSEGEEVFVAFLYFVESLKSDLNNEYRGRTVVLDDPVSGLDTETLSTVASITSDLAAAAAQNKDGIDQLLVLTHSRDYLAAIFPPDRHVKRFSLVKRESKTRIISLL